MLFLLRKLQVVTEYTLIMVESLLPFISASSAVMVSVSHACTGCVEVIGFVSSK